MPESEITVPRIDTAEIAKLEQAVPGICAVQSIEMIRSAYEAERAAKKVFKAQSSKSRFMKRNIESITLKSETEAGWTFSFAYTSIDTRLQ